MVHWCGSRGVQGSNRLGTCQPRISQNVQSFWSFSPFALQGVRARPSTRSLRRLFVKGEGRGTRPIKFPACPSPSLLGPPRHGARPNGDTLNSHLSPVPSASEDHCRWMTVAERARVIVNFSLSSSRGQFFSGAHLKRTKKREIGEEFAV